MSITLYASNSQRTHDRASGNEGIVAVIPTCNDERIIGSAVLLARQYVGSVIVLDCGSSDQTASLAYFAGATVVSLTHKDSRELALRAGLKLALEQKNLHAIVLFDANEYHNAAEVPVVVRPVLEAQADLVIGSRLVEVRRNIPWWHQAGQHGLSWMTGLASTQKTRVPQSNFHALSPIAARLLLFECNEEISLEAEMQSTIQNSNLKQMEVIVGNANEDHSLSSPAPLWRQLIDNFLHLVAQMRPLLFFGVPSIVFLLIGFAFGILSVHIYDQAQERAIVYALITVLFTVVGAIGLSSAIVLHSVRALLMMRREQETVWADEARDPEPLESSFPMAKPALEKPENHPNGFNA